MAASRCPCGSGLSYGECCGRLHDGALAPTAEALMRSRFSAFAVGDVAYLLSTWHPTTRPSQLSLDNDVRWYRLDIGDRIAGGPLDSTGIVEFEAFHKGRSAGSLHERSRFVRENGLWFYLEEE